MEGKDLSYALRALAARKGMAALVAGIVALGIGATVTVFGIADAFLLRGLPFAEPERLVWLQSRHGDGLLGVSHADAADWNDPAIFTGVASFDAQNHAVVSFADGAESLLAARVDSSLFPLLGVAARNGRVFGPAEDQPGGGQVVLLSHGLWRRRFGASEAAVGATVKVDGLLGDVQIETARLSPDHTSRSGERSAEMPALVSGYWVSRWRLRAASRARAAASETPGARRARAESTRTLR